MQVVSEPHFRKSWSREYEGDYVSMSVTMNPQELILNAKLVGLCWLAYLLDAVQRK